MNTIVVYVINSSVVSFFTNKGCATPDCLAPKNPIEAVVIHMGEKGWRLAGIDSAGSTFYFQK